MFKQQVLESVMTAAEERTYIIRHQPTRAMMLGLIPYPERCSDCGSPDGCVCC